MTLSHEGNLLQALRALAYQVNDLVEWAEADAHLAALRIEGLEVPYPGSPVPIATGARIPPTSPEEGASLWAHLWPSDEKGNPVPLTEAPPLTEAQQAERERAIVDAIETADAALGMVRDMTAPLGRDATLERAARSMCAARAAIGEALSYSWNPDRVAPKPAKEPLEQDAQDAIDKARGSEALLKAAVDHARSHAAPGECAYPDATPRFIEIWPDAHNAYLAKLVIDEVARDVPRLAPTSNQRKHAVPHVVALLAALKSGTKVGAETPLADALATSWFDYCEDDDDITAETDTTTGETTARARARYLLSRLVVVRGRLSRIAPIGPISKSAKPRQKRAKKKTMKRSRISG